MKSEIFKRYFIFYLSVISVIGIFSVIFGLINKLEFNIFMIITVIIMALVFDLAMSYYCYSVAKDKHIKNIDKSKYDKVIEAIEKNLFILDKDENNIIVYYVNRKPQMLFKAIKVRIIMNMDTNKMDIILPEYMASKLIKII